MFILSSLFHVSLVQKIFPILPAWFTVSLYVGFKVISIERYCRRLGACSPFPWSRNEPGNLFGKWKGSHWTPYRVCPRSTVEHKSDTAFWVSLLLTGRVTSSKSSPLNFGFLISHIMGMSRPVQHEKYVGHFKRVDVHGTPPVLITLMNKLITILRRLKSM